MKPPLIDLDTTHTNAWREKILQAILRGTFVFAIIALAGGIINVVERYQESGDTVTNALVRAYIVIGLYTLSTVIVGLAAFRPTLSYSVRALTLLSIYYGIGCMGLYFAALSGDGRIFFFAVSVLAAILFGRRVSFLALATTILTLAIFAVLFVTRTIALAPSYQANSVNLSAWFSGIAVYTLLSFVAVISILYLVRSLEESLAHNQQKHAQLQQSETYFRTLIENSTDAIALMDPQGNVLYASPSTWRVSGYSAEEFIGRNALQDVHPEDLAAAQQFLQQLFQTPGEVAVATYRFKHKRGDWRWLEGTVHNSLSIPDVNALVVNYRDVTARRQYEVALRESEAHLQKVNNVLRIITGVNQLVVREQDKQGLLDQVCQLFINHREYAFTWFGLLAEDGVTCEFAAASRPVNPTEYTFRLDDIHHHLQCVAGAVRGREPIIVSPETCTVCPVLANPPEHTTLALPLRRGELTLGVWVVYASHGDLFDDEEIALLQELADDLAYALYNLHNEQQRHHRAEQQRILAETAADILSQHDFNHLLTTIVTAVRQTLKADRVALYQFDPDKNRVHCPYAWGLTPQYVEAVNNHFQNIPGFSILSSPEPVAINDIQTDPRTGYLRQEMIAEGFRSYVVFPLLSPEHPLGGLTVYRDQVSQFTPSDLASGQTLAHLISVALQNMQLFTKLQKRVEEAETLRQVGSVIATTLEQDKTIELILQQLARVIPYDSASVQLLGDGYLEIVGGRGWPDMAQVQGLRFPIPGDNPNTIVIQEKRPHIVTFVTNQHGNFRRSPHNHIQSWLGVPLMVRERLIGMLAIDSKDPAFFTEEQARLVTTFGDQVAVALENARLFEETNRQAAELAALIELSSVLRTALTRSEIQNLTLDYALEMLGVDEGAILAPNPEQSGLQVIASRRWANALRKITFGLDNSLAGRVFTTGIPIVSSDFTQEKEALSTVTKFLQANGTRAGIYVPLRSGSEPIGVLCIDTKQDRTFDADEVRLLTAIAEIAGSAIHRAMVLETLEQRVQERTAELIAANERLKQLDRLKDEFVTNVNHELRTPLTNITMYLDLLHARGGAALERYLPILRRESKRLTQLIEDMLTLSRLEQGQVPFQPNPHQLDDLLAEVLQTYEARIRAKSLVVEHTPMPYIPPVPVDYPQMVQVFTNLIGNAVAYTPTGGQLKVTLSWAKNSSRYVELTINNTGSLIAPDEIPHLFDRFFRGKTGRESGEPGTGLGLAICQEIVARHGGHISVTSSEGKGTTFQVQLPAF
ncbi:MAG: GAF domain-containing protein [Anaerolineae bacterium]|nr:GAF domain-containing protein [Anaerolineae bacterium]